MRKIAAHYWLRPDGSVGKFPILTFDEEKTLVEVRERDVFTEEAGLELVNGFLIPAFINIVGKISNVGNPDLRALINKQKISGVKVLGVSHNDVSRFREITITGLKIEGYSERIELTGNHVSVFSFLCNSNAGLQELMQFTLHNAKKLKIDYDYGSFEIGKKPGLLSISKMDYSNFTLSKDSKLKIVFL